MTFPYPVPPAIVVEADALGGTSTPRHKQSSTATFVLHLLDARGDIVFSSPPLTGNQLKVYVYEFNVKVNLLKWRFKLVLTFEWKGELTVFSKTFTVDTGTVTPKGSGARIRVVGRSASVSDAAKHLRIVSGRKRKYPAPALSGFSTSRPVRPNESKTTTHMDFTYLRYTGADPWLGSPTYPTYVGYSRVWTGSRTPGFGGIPAKLLPVNPHTVSLRRTIDGPMLRAGYNVVNGSASGRFSRHTTYYVGASTPSHLAAASALALKRLISAAGSDIEANIAQDLAQLNQTLDLIRGSVNRITKAVFFLRRGNIVEAERALFGSAKRRYRGKRQGPTKSQSLADNWLEMQYGWKPLINDVHGVMQSLKYLKIDEGHVARTTASGKVKTVTTVPEMAFITPPIVAGTRTVTVHSSAKYGIYWSYSDHLKAFLAQTGFTNPVNLAWEILPFSFVVDWFYPIGPFLETLSAWDGLVFVGGYHTRFTRQWTDIALSYQRVNPLNANAREFGDSAYHDNWVILDRVKLTSFPGSVLPSVKNGLASVTHLANALALMKSVFGK